MVLVEGMSDQAADKNLAERSGRDLNAEGVFVVPMGGATNVGHFVDLFGPGGFGVRLACACDQGEEPISVAASTEPKRLTSSASRTWRTN